jgi:predicted dehydrogenase
VSAIRAAVIGAGAIGARLDAATDAASPMTHAGGYRAAGFAIAGLVDTDADARAMAGRWNAPVYSNIEEMMASAKPDVVSVATPAAGRAALLLEVLKAGPRAVVSEKPLTETVDQSRQIVEAFRDADVPLLVNYSRRYTPLWQAVSDRVAMSAVIRYGKGLLHNGTHAIDLCRMLFGECLDAVPLSRKNDHASSDPSVSAFLKFERCPEVFLQALDEREFTLFEVDIVGSNWRLIVDSDGRRARHFDLHHRVGIPPGRRLIEVRSADTGAASAMINLMRNARDVLDGGVPLCTGEDAIAAQLIAGRLA